MPRTEPRVNRDTRGNARQNYQFFLVAKGGVFFYSDIVLFTGEDAGIFVVSALQSSNLHLRLRVPRDVRSGECTLTLLLPESWKGEGDDDHSFDT